MQQQASLMLMHYKLSWIYSQNLFTNVIIDYSTDSGALATKSKLKKYRSFCDMAVLIKD
jgi:hypothetical protein